MEKFLETKGLLVEAEDYVEKAIQDTEELSLKEKIICLKRVVKILEVNNTVFFEGRHIVCDGNKRNGA